MSGYSLIFYEKKEEKKKEIDLLIGITVSIVKSRKYFSAALKILTKTAETLNSWVGIVEV